MRPITLAGITWCVSLCLTAQPPKAQADEIVTFDASGTFTDGTELGGSLTIDVTTGDITTYDLTTSGPINATLDHKVAAESSGGYLLFLVDDNGGYPAFQFILDATSLVGFQGGYFGSYDQPLGNAISVLSVNVDVVDLVSGDLTPVPEPASLPILGLGASLLVVAGRRRVAEGKVFFSEEKKQKTFGRRSRTEPATLAAETVLKFGVTTEVNLTNSPNVINLYRQIWP